jgi:lipoprotein-anchoring transpeptidase ErfK/SrfK
MDALSSPLTQQQQAVLIAHGWENRVGEALAVWVSVEKQVFRVVRAGRVLLEVPCATAARGTGSHKNSHKTPLGWHSVKTKVGAGAPWGQVFRNSRPVNEVWKPGQKANEDLVLTRLLWLTGEEPGKNKGGEVDSYQRFIYIHGTNEEDRIGTPSSHGCVRLRNDDVITAFDLIPEGTLVLITKESADKS